MDSASKGKKPLSPVLLFWQVSKASSQFQQKPEYWATSKGGPKAAMQVE